MEELLTKLKQDARENFVPIVRDETLKALLNCIKENKPQRILEIGTAVGYSALNMLNVSGADIVTIEKNPDRCVEAMQNFKKADCMARIRLLQGDAIEILDSLVKGQEAFDFAFLDGPKGQYIKYLPFILKLLNKNGVIFADNVGLLGLVADSEKVNHKNRTMVRNMQAFLQQVTSDVNLKTTIYDVDDGYAIIKKI